MWIRSQYERLAAGRALGGDQCVADLGERPALLLRGLFRFGRALHDALHGHVLAQLTQCRLGLCAGEAVDVPLGVYEPEPALNLAAAVAPLRDPGVAVGAGAADERPAAVPSATLRALYRCAFYL